LERRSPGDVLFFVFENHPDGSLSDFLGISLYS
jgi:hypothetical protein